MKLIIEREATFENNSDIWGQSNTEKIITSLLNETQWSKICSTVKSPWQAKHPWVFGLSRQVEQTTNDSNNQQQ